MHALQCQNLNCERNPTIQTVTARLLPCTATSIPGTSWYLQISGCANGSLATKIFKSCSWFPNPQLTRGATALGGRAFHGQSPNSRPERTAMSILWAARTFGHTQRIVRRSEDAKSLVRLQDLAFGRSKSQCCRRYLAIKSVADQERLLQSFFAATRLSSTRGFAKEPQEPQHGRSGKGQPRQYPSRSPYNSASDSDAPTS